MTAPDVAELAEALHDVMCTVSHHDRPPARCHGWLKYPAIARAAVEHWPADLRRAPVQADSRRRVRGTIPWSTHLLAWEGYAAAGHGDQSAERIAKRGGFGYAEVQCAIAGHYSLTANCRSLHPVPDGWRPR